MAIKCNPCDCVDQYYKNEWTWKRAVLSTLCQLVNIDVEFSASAQVGLEGSLAFGAVTTAYATLISNPTAKVIRTISVYNTLNQVALISLDGGVSGYVHVPASTGVVSKDLAVNGLYSISNISVKTIGGNPGSGNIYAVASY